MELGVLNFKDAEALSDEQLQLLSGEDANADDAHAGANAGDNEPALYFDGDEGGAFADYVTAGGDVVDLTGIDDDSSDTTMRDDDEGEEEDRGQGGSRRGGARSKDHTSARPSAAAAGASAAAGGGMTVSIRQHKYCSDCADYVQYYEEDIEGRGSVPCCRICKTVIEA
jgi:hypothetical protein